MGDQSGYADNYCDAMDELASCFEKQGATIVGAWSSEGYEHEDSKSRIAGTEPQFLCTLELTMSLLNDGMRWQME